MDMFVVQGGRRLGGRVTVSGAKNSALPMLAAALAADGTTVLHGVPDLVDVRTMASLVSQLGCAVEIRPDHAISVTPVNESCCVADYELVRRMRASVCVLGPLLAKRGKACVSLPGGCNIGDRPIDLHIKGLRALGAEIRIERGYVIAEADQLRGARIYLGGPFGSTATGTCNVMVAAALAKGESLIEAAACEPEVVDFGNLLIRMGARISGLGTPFIRIEGVPRLQAAEHRIIPDRIEAATLMIAAAITAGNVELVNTRPDHLTAVIEKLREIGVTVEQGEDAAFGLASLRVERSGPIRSTDCIALPYPAIPTDVQAQLMALLAQADGISIVTDKVFPDRFMHAAELVRMGSRIRREMSSAIISGVPHLSGACVMASDLRASAALVLAALAAEGETVIRRIYHLDRGYDRFDLKLNRLGAQIMRLEDRADNIPTSLQLLDDSPTGCRIESGQQLSGPAWLQNRPDQSIRVHSALGAESPFPGGNTVEDD